MFPSRSDTEVGVDPHRPDDHLDSAPVDVTQPQIGLRGIPIWAWRQLTSMRTALVLLLFLAVAAVPGSLFPQRSADPNGVTQWKRDNPDLFAFVDSVGLFDVYVSPWFSAIYLLLFTSLVGCVVPRARHHYTALRSRPPRTPARLSRLSAHMQTTLPVTAGENDSTERAITLAEGLLRKAGYRVELYSGPGWSSVSAERGYLRETGNLVFHVALVGIIVSVAIGGSFAYTGQRVVVEGTTFVNALSDYSSFNPGRFVDGAGLTSYSLRLNDFKVAYQLPGAPGAGQAGDFSANVTVRGDDTAKKQDLSVRVNAPLTIAGDRIYLLGNGYAPTLSVRNARGDVVYRDSQPFLPQDTNMTSLGVIKVVDGMPEQLGLVGFFYPTQGTLPSGAFTSIYPDVINPVLTMNVYSGDLGIDDGTPRSVYTLDTSGLTQRTGGKTGVQALKLTPGTSADLPDGLGTVTWEISSSAAPVKRFASLQIQHDPSSGWVLGFAIVATLGLFAGLFLPRRRLWVKARPVTDGIVVEYAGLARGDDPTLQGAVTALAKHHARQYHDDRPGSENR
ncbi:cytochrome c biogenesis protein ResB [Microbacterium sp. USTB-Y]|uniref:cytochrome c biogenesis protein ResB n=1 Tax=Microbacterium sp. USTB-Y TaxID=2823692 RepID=UPI00203B4EBE|nr:cytochrome c biogenesis protein ResB [Microbacterium sp. USTB-Y]